MKKKHRGFSSGSILMILLSLIVFVSGGFVIQRLTDTQGQSVVTENDENILFSGWTIPTPDGDSGISQSNDVPPEPATATPDMTSIEAMKMENGDDTSGSAVFSFGGIVALETSIRQSGYDKKEGTYDFTEILQAVNPYMQGNVAWAQLDNSVIPGAQVSDTVSPDEISGMLVSGGIGYVSLGFAKALDHGTDGIRSTELSMEGAGIEHNGAYRNAADSELGQRITDINGIQTALLQYTESLSSTGKKKSQSAPFAVPLLADAENDIRRVRELGAELVVVRLNWGTVGKTQPTKNQKEMAHRLADAGADIIIGCGSRRVQEIEILHASDKRQVLCAYSLGTMLQASTKSGAMEGIILQVSVHCEQNKNISFSDIEYIPTFIWHAKENGKNVFRVIPSMGKVPETMTSAQEKLMKQSAERIDSILKDGPATLSAEMDN